MQQFVTILKVRGKAARSAISRCRRTKRADLMGLKEEFKSELGQPHLLTHIEYFDGWLMGDSFDALARPVGPMARRAAECGAVYFGEVTPEVCRWAERQARRKRQFDEERWLFERLLACALDYKKLGGCEAIFVFRKVVGASLGDDEIPNTGRLPPAIVLR
jgi:hypothetical protein